MGRIVQIATSKSGLYALDYKGRIWFRQYGQDNWSRVKLPRAKEIK